MDKNDEKVGPGDPYPFEGKVNPYMDYLKSWGQASNYSPSIPLNESYLEKFMLGTTSVEAADKEGWVVSITPSGGWIPSCIAGKTGVGMSQRMQSFVTDPKLNPFNVVAPGKQPRVTLTPTLALKDGKPFLSFAVQGGDSQDQNLLQFFLNVVEFGMNVQEAVEAPNVNTYQMFMSLGGFVLWRMAQSKESEQATKYTLHKQSGSW
jgi:gamma-glutamyltranspeptidase/glutathione hydrolase